MLSLVRPVGSCWGPVQGKCGGTHHEGDHTQTEHALQFGQSFTTHPLTHCSAKTTETRSLSHSLKTDDIDVSKFCSRRLVSWTVTTVLLASDADWLIEEVRSALSDPGTDVTVVRAGADVRNAVSTQSPELVILDLQIGNMGGMATCMDLQLEIGAGRITDVPILMLLDRSADVYLAQQAGAQGWLVKPLDSFRLKVASVKLLAGDDMRNDIVDDAASESDPVMSEETFDSVAEDDENQNGEPAEVG